MEPNIQPTLYIDEQLERRTDHCPSCGGVRYYPGCRCIRCERREP